MLVPALCRVSKAANEGQRVAVFADVVHHLRVDHVDFGCAGRKDEAEVQLSRKDADDGDGFVVEGDGLADDVCGLPPNCDFQ